uniref:Uncharacterized protein n=2 Tax=Biomphalaria glabrata TaxID=6526 RepID=A0A2C9KBH8_BIOGL
MIKSNFVGVIKTMDTDSSAFGSQLLDYVIELEGVAEEILADRREIIDLDRQRNKTREAVRALQKNKSNTKTWLCAGNMFIKVETKKAINMLNKDFDVIENEISKLRSTLKPKVNKLRDLEKKDDLKGFNLSPLTPSELNSVESLL